MNIFYLDPNPLVAPRYFYNRHCVKMILESAQMLCTAHHESGGTAPYKSAYKNHPSTQWARASKANYNWLFQHMCAIGEEYNRRYGKIHQTMRKCALPLSQTPDLPDLPFTPPPQCMPDEYKHDCTLTAYWQYYCFAKQHIATSSEVVISKPFHNNQGQFYTE